MRKAGHVAHLRDKRNECRVLVLKAKERNVLEDVSLDGNIILK